MINLIKKLLVETENCDAEMRASSKLKRMKSERTLKEIQESFQVLAASGYSIKDIRNN